jgi:uncharacterized protein (TIGR02117 family)
VGGARLVFRTWLCACLALLAACSGPAQRAEATGDGAATVYVVRRGWHTDVAFPVEGLHGPLQLIAAEFPGARYLVFGFGDRRYLLSRGRDFGDELLALWPGAGLILVTGLQATPQQAFGANQVVALRLPPQRADAVADYVRDSLQLDSGALRSVAPGPYPDSLFYASTRTYSGLHTCNTWTAEALRAGAVPVDSAGVIFAWQLWSQLQP